MDQPPFLARLLEAAVLADDLTDAGERANAHLIERLFTESVDVLRHLQDSDLSTMGADAWKVIEHKYVLTVMHPQIPSLGMAVLAERDIKQKFIFIPTTWAAMFVAAPVRQLGAVAFVCSQAVDAYNERDPKTMNERAVAYEGAFLRFVEASDLDDGQRKAMASPPPSEFAYQRAEVPPPS